MSNKLFYLICLALVLALAGFAQAELLVNPGFEADLEGWKTWGGGSGSGAGGAFYNSDTHATVMNDGTAHGGEKYVEVGIADVEGSWWAVSFVFQEHPVTEGHTYQISGWLRDGDADGAASLVEGGGQLQWEWRDAAPGAESDTGDRGGVLEGGRVSHSFDLTEEWTYVSATEVAPPGAKGATIIFGTTWGGINLDVDDGSYIEILPVRDPNPADGAIGISSEPLLNTPVSDDVPLNIPDRRMTTTTVTSSLTVADSFTITDLNVELDISHSKNNADLNVYLVGPDGTQVELFTDVGVWNKGFKNTVLDDEAGISIKNGSGSFTGSFKPEKSLSAFDGKNAQGTWKLKVSDDWNSGTGTVNSWGLVIESPNVLSWVPADNAASQDVYIGDNFNDVNDSTEAAYQGNFAADVSTIEFILDLDQAIFWRVDSLDADGMLVATGDIWSFATAPEPIFVDPSSDLAAATEPAKPGGTVVFAEGTYNITSQIIVKEGVTYQGAGPELTIIDGGGVTRAFAAWGDRSLNEGNENPNDSGPKRWVIEGMTIQNCVADTNDRFSFTASAFNMNEVFADNDADVSGGLNPEEADAVSGGIRLAGEDGTEGTEDDDLHRFEHIDTDGSGELSQEELLAQMAVVEDEFGDETNDGGAITIENEAVGTIANCNLLDNYTPAGGGDDGGAINITGRSTVTINDCLFDGNYAVSPDSVEVEGSDGDAGHIKVQGNNLTDGFINVGTTLIANRCVFLNGNAEDDAGAIQSNAQGVVTRLDSCWFEGNTAWDNGTVLQFPNEDQNEATVTNCVFVNNITKADNSPDRMIETRRNSKFVNCTFVGNVQEDQDLIYNNANKADGDHDGTDDELADVTQVMNCIFLNNVVGDGDHVLGSRNNDFSIAATNCLFFGNTLQNGDPAENTQRPAEETGSIMEDPLLDDELVPSEGSPAIDASDPDTATAADIVGMPAFGIRDVGAYESEFEPPPSYTFDGTLDDTWDHDNGSDQWDGTGPGEGNPGGAVTLAEDDVDFMRIQDIGDPRDLGISEPSNRKVYLTRLTDISLDGLSIEVRMRVATTAPLDNQVSGDPWPAEGIGYHIRDGGKGMIGVSDGVGIISFSLGQAGEPDYVDAASDLLVMNNLVGTEPTSDVDTEDAANAVATNMMAIDDAAQWNTFVIDIVAGGAGTHVVTVSANGGSAESFDVTLGSDMEADAPFIAIGSSGTGGITAFDVDYILVK